MKIGEVEAFVEKAVRADMPALLIGPAGCGKTYTAAVGAKAAGRDVLTLDCSVANPTFFAGYPFRENGHANHAPFGVLWEAMGSSKPCALVLEELLGPSPETIRAALRLVQFREVGGKRLPDHVSILATGNDVGCGAEVQGLMAPMQDRFTIIKVEPCVDDLILYGFRKGWPAWVMGWLRIASAPDGVDILHEWKHVRGKVLPEHPTARGIEDVAKWDAAGVDDTEVWAGRIGKGRALEARAAKDMLRELPDPDAIFLDPDGALVPENPSAKWMTASMLASKVNGRNFGQALKYLHRLPQMFRAYTLLSATKAENAKLKDGTLGKDYRRMCDSPDYVSWACSKDGAEIRGA